MIHFIHINVLFYIRAFTRGRTHSTHIINLLFYRYLTFLSSGNQRTVASLAKRAGTAYSKEKTGQMGIEPRIELAGFASETGTPVVPARDDPRERISTAGGGCELA